MRSAASSATAMTNRSVSEFMRGRVSGSGEFRRQGRRIAVAAKYQRSFVQARTPSPVNGLGHQMMMGRQVAHRIGIRGIAGEQVCLTTAAAEITGFFRATSARFLHPAVAAEVSEAR